MKILASSDLSKVTSCMQHALSSRYPRTRYSAGWDAKFLWIPLSYLPTCVADIFTSIIMPSIKSWTSLERITESNNVTSQAFVFETVIAVYATFITQPCILKKTLILTNLMMLS